VLVHPWFGCLRVFRGCDPVFQVRQFVVLIRVRHAGIAPLDGLVMCYDGARPESISAPPSPNANQAIDLNHEIISQTIRRHSVAGAISPENAAIAYSTKWLTI